MSLGGNRAAAAQTTGPFEHDAAAAAGGGRDEGAVLAFDFGARRIGVAVGDTRLGIAHPLATLAAADNRRRFEAIATLVAEWQPVRFVLGTPQAAGERAHALMPSLLRFERRLAARFGLPVERIDETLSSWDASRRLGTKGKPTHAQKQKIDAMAACVILETWFEQRRSAAAGCVREPA